jgi:SAM-dependent methyltransferase
VLEPELMDDPSLDPSDHARALRGLARINRLSFAGRSHLPALRMVARRVGGPVRVLDVGAGSGDVAVSLALAGRRSGVSVSLVLADISPRAVEAARRRAAEAGLDAQGMVLDAVAGPLPGADLAVCSLFLHHLTEAQAVAVLGNMRDSVAEAGGVVSVNDLRRGAWGSVLADTVPRVVTGSRVVHSDAAVSARAAWTAPELLDLAARAGMGGARVRPCFPARMTMVWSAA